MSNTYLSTVQLAARLPYSERTIRDDLKDSIFIEGIHYLRPFGRRKILYIWEAIENDLLNGFKLAIETPEAVDSLASVIETKRPNAQGLSEKNPPQLRIKHGGIPMANGGVCNG